MKPMLWDDLRKCWYIEVLYVCMGVFTTLELRGSAPAFFFFSLWSFSTSIRICISLSLYTYVCIYTHTLHIPIHIYIYVSIHIIIYIYVLVLVTSAVLSSVRGGGYDGHDLRSAPCLLDRTHKHWSGILGRHGKIAPAYVSGWPNNR